ncbi:MAG: uncharacterized protein QOH35_505 [Acidobacteriaceae bacterium]|jgi:hypothetical protein|nr:uncharacterized protein [Acidobacteriaceae bacterium]MDX6463046.1 uncharacterized protein [Acidobacteriaceae bacterium]MEA2260028.1 uncharacterized protein [Acidobacteriaceae bacterium]MEA2539139.1 uncharacterized protein [Acidobacteriaceae bacterium]MEA3004864.1 uncharacterized protein [Acidobacteriaceae bacterium]
MQIPMVMWARLGRRVAHCALVWGGLTLLGAQTAPVTVNWQTLQTLNFNLPRSQQKAPVLQLAGKRVSIPGFMVPLEDDLEQVREFLLVPYAGACIHVPAPPPNQIVYVKMQKTTKVHVTFTDPIMVTGTLQISTVQSPYGDVSYDLSGESVVPYQQ